MRERAPADGDRLSREGVAATRWATTLASKVNLQYAISCRALCGENVVTAYAYCRVRDAGSPACGREHTDAGEVAGGVRRARDQERDHVLLHPSAAPERDRVCMRERTREKVCVCVCERERNCVCVCVCGRV